MVEEKEKLTVKEFKAWLVGLIRGKKGALPDLEDWMKIKEMLDKVEDEQENKQNVPYPFPMATQPETTPYIPQWEKWYWTNDKTGTDVSDNSTWLITSSTTNVSLDSTEEKDKQMRLELLWK